MTRIQLHSLAPSFTQTGCPRACQMNFSKPKADPKYANSHKIRSSDTSREGASSSTSKRYAAWCCPKQTARSDCRADRKYPRGRSKQKERRMPLVHIRQIPLVARASVAEHLLRVSGKSGVERSIGLLGPALLWLFLPEFRPLPSTADGGSSEKQPVQEVQRLGFLTVLVLVMAPILCRIPHRRHDGSRVHERQVVQVANGARDALYRSMTAGFRQSRSPGWHCIISPIGL